MIVEELSRPVPDIEFSWTCGGTVNPRCFVGHQLLVLFLPERMEDAAAELAAYDALADEFAGFDAWFLVVGNDPLPSRATPIALDQSGAGWTAFSELTGDPLTRSDGATFLFTKGGALHCVWSGPGHAGDALAELQTRQ